jgi:signal transduction histidine kinase
MKGDSLMKSKDTQQSVAADRELVNTMAHELHDMAQPLTLLQGVLDLALYNADTVERYRHSVAQAMGELKRVIVSFGRMRQLVRPAEPAGGELPSSPAPAQVSARLRSSAAQVVSIERIIKHV